MYHPFELCLCWEEDVKNGYFEAVFCLLKQLANEREKKKRKLVDDSGWTKIGKKRETVFCSRFHLLPSDLLKIIAKKVNEV